MPVPRRRWAAMSGAFSAALLMGAFYRPVVVLGHSMEPTLRDRQIVWMDRQAPRLGGISKGDIVVFEKDGTVYVKRVLGAPGDVVGLAQFENGDCWLLDDLNETPDGRRLATRLRMRRILHNYRVPDGHIYVVGDNRSVSMDSRDFGPVPISCVDGVITGFRRVRDRERHTRLAAAYASP